MLQGEGILQIGLHYSVCATSVQWCSAYHPAQYDLWGIHTYQITINELYSYGLTEFFQLLLEGGLTATGIPINAELVNE